MRGTQESGVPKRCRLEHARMQTPQPQPLTEGWHRGVVVVDILSEVEERVSQNSNLVSDKPFRPGGDQKVPIETRKVVYIVKS